MEESPVLVHGIRERNCPDSDIELKREEFKRLGYAILPSVVPNDILEQARQKIDAVYAMQEKEIGQSYTLGMLNDSNIARGLLAYDDFFC